MLKVSKSAIAFVMTEFLQLYPFLKDMPRR